MTTVNAKMIILARESRGLNQAELAGKLGFTPTYLSKIERGEVIIPEDTLIRIAEITNYPASLFWQQGDIVPESFNYRKREKVAQKLLTSVNAKVNVARLHITALVRELQLSIPHIPSHSVTDSKSAILIAKQIRREWGVPNGAIRNVTELLESHGIAIVQLDFGTERIDSRTILTDDKYPVIVLNKSLQGDRQRFSLAYQLGHLVMHNSNSVTWDADINHEANIFAAEFLAPEAEMKDLFANGITLSLLGELKQKWKISMISLLYRADDLGFISLNQKRYLLQQFNDRKIRRREPIELDVGAEKPTLIRTWLEQLKKRQKLGSLELAEKIHLHREEFIEIYG